MRKKQWSLFFIAVMATSNLMCGFGAYDFDQDRFTKIEPETPKMVGNYVPTKETISLIRETGLYDLEDISISLFSDGTFEMKNMPDWWITPSGESNGGADSGKGKWSVLKRNWWWQIEFEFQSGTFSSRAGLSDSLYTTKDVSGDQPPYSLWFYIGDPDRGRVMIFEQVLANQ